MPLLHRQLFCAGRLATLHLFKTYICRRDSRPFYPLRNLLCGQGGVSCISDTNATSQCLPLFASFTIAKQFCTFQQLWCVGNHFRPPHSTLQMMYILSRTSRLSERPQVCGTFEPPEGMCYAGRASHSCSALAWFNWLPLSVVATPLQLDLLSAITHLLTRADYCLNRVYLSPPHRLIFHTDILLAVNRHAAINIWALRSAS